MSEMQVCEMHRRGDHSFDIQLQLLEMNQAQMNGMALGAIFGVPMAGANLGAMFMSFNPVDKKREQPPWKVYKPYPF